MSLLKWRTIMFDSSWTYTHTLYHCSIQNDITHACYIHMYTIEAKYVYSSIKLYVVLYKQLIKCVKKSGIQLPMTWKWISFINDFGYLVGCAWLFVCVYVILFVWVSVCGRVCICGLCVCVGRGDSCNM